MKKILLSLVLLSGITLSAQKKDTAWLPTQGLFEPPPTKTMLSLTILGTSSGCFQPYHKNDSLPGMYCPRIPVLQPVITFEDPENFYDRLDSAMSYFVHITCKFLGVKEYFKARQEFSDLLFRLVDTGKKDTITIYQPLKQ